jgi:hypothetical protein
MARWRVISLFALMDSHARHKLHYHLSRCGPTRKEAFLISRNYRKKHINRFASRLSLAVALAYTTRHRKTDSESTQKTKGQKKNLPPTSDCPNKWITPDHRMTCSNTASRWNGSLICLLRKSVKGFFQENFESQHAGPLH